MPRQLEAQGADDSMVDNASSNKQIAHLFKLQLEFELVSTNQVEDRYTTETPLPVDSPYHSHQTGKQCSHLYHRDLQFLPLGIGLVDADRGIDLRVGAEEFLQESTKLARNWDANHQLVATEPYLEDVHGT